MKVKGVTKRKDGYYIARGTDNRGKRAQKIFKEEKEAIAWVHKFESDKGVNLDVSKIKFSVLFDEFIRTRSLTVRDTTIRNYISIYNNNFKEYLGDKYVDEIKLITLQRMFDELCSRKQLKLSTAKTIKCSLVVIMNFAIKYEYLNKNRAKYIEINKNLEYKPKEALTPEEQKEFMLSIQNSEYMSIVCGFILQTGMRIGEVCGLRWSDIDFKNKIINVSNNIVCVNNELIDRQPKTKNGIRKIPITKECERLLGLQKIRNSKIKNIKFEALDYVFVTIKTGGKMNPNCIKQMLFDYRNTYKPNFYVSAHILRHTFATRCIEAGMNPKTLQVILGHSNISITMDRYVHVVDNTLLNEMQSVERNLSAN